VAEHLEQALVSLAALARLIDAGLPQTAPHSGTPSGAATPSTPAQATNLFRADGDYRPDHTVDLTRLPEVNGFEVVKRLQREHTGGTTLVRLPGVTDPKSTGGRSGRVGSGVTGRLITG
jgi:alpha-ketoglutarate-dependent taurine dioxygenase